MYIIFLSRIKSYLAFMTFVFFFVMIFLFIANSVRAQTLIAGDLIKSDNPAVYYYGKDKKRYVFPNEKTFKTWYKGFSDVKVISAEELAAIPIGGNIVYRSGTRLIKITTDSKVYAVEPGGILRHVSTEKIAVDIYGENWNKKIDDVPDSFFVNYKVGDPLGSNEPPLGSIIQVGEQKYYINDKGEKEILTESGMKENLFREEFLLKISNDQITRFSDGAVINERFDKLNDTAQVTEPVRENLSGTVEVELSKDKLNIGDSIPSGAEYVKLLCLDFNNGTDQTIKLEGIKVQKMGVLSDAGINAILITNGNGNLHGSNVTFGDGVATSSFSSEPIIISSGEKTNVCINGNIALGIDSGTIGVKVFEANDFFIKTARGGDVKIEGGFPFIGNLFQIVGGQGALGQLEISQRPVASGTTANPTEIDLGSKDLEIAKFRLQEITGNEPLELLNINIRNNGTAANQDFGNIRLVDQNNTLLGSARSMINNEAKFFINLANISSTELGPTIIGPNGGWVIPEGQTREVRVILDTFAQKNSSNRTINLVIQEANDVRALGTETHVGGRVAAAQGNAFPIGNGFNVVRLRVGGINFSRASDSRSGKITKGTKNIELGEFDINVFGEDIELQAIEYVIRSTAANGLFHGNQVLNGSIKILDISDNILFTQTASDANNYGTACLGGALTVANNLINCAGGGGDRANGTSSLKTFNSYYQIQAGKIGKVRFIADINQNVVGESYTAVITGYQIRRMSANIIVTQNNALNIPANILMVDSSTLSANINTSFSLSKLVLGGSIQKLASFNLRAGAGETQKITSVKVRFCGRATAGNVTGVDCDNTLNNAGQLQAVSSIILKHKETAVSEAFNITSNTGFTVSTDLSIAANTTQEIDVYGIVSSAWQPAFLGVGFEISSTVGDDSQTTLNVPEIFSPGIPVFGSGQIFAAPITDGDVNIPKFINANSEQVPLFLFQIVDILVAEDINLINLYFGGNGLSNFKNFSLVQVAGGIPGPVGVHVPQNNGEIRFTGLNHNIEKITGSTLILFGTPNDAGSLNFNDNIAVLGVTYVEFSGKISGANDFFSGGLLVNTGTSTINDTVGVNDISNFENNDLVQVDWNKDGDFFDVFAGDGINELTQYTVCNVDAANGTIQLGNGGCGGGQIVDILLLANFVERGRISGFSITTSNPVQIEEVNPSIKVHPNFQDLSQANDSQVGTFQVIASGSRPLSMEHLVIEVSGSFENSGVKSFAPRNFQLWRAGADGNKSVQVNTGSAQLNYVPSGINTALVNGTPVQGATSIPFDNGIANRPFNPGDRITFRAPAGNCAGAEVNTNGSLGYRVIQAPNAVAGTLTLSPGIRVALLNNSVICPLTSNDTTISNPEAIGQTIISVTSSAGFSIGDIVSFTDIVTPNILRNNGSGYRIISIPDANSITISPGLETALAANDLVRGDGNNVGINDAVESNARLRFDLPDNEQVGADSEAFYSIVADTSLIKDPASSGSSAITIKIPGSRGVSSAGNGFVWSYQSASAVQRNQLDITNSYPVTGKTNNY